MKLIRHRRRARSYPARKPELRCGNNQVIQSEQRWANEGPYCTFWLDGTCYGVEVLQVQEVLRPQRITPVPLAPPAVRGLINLRGEVVPAIDLRRRLGLRERPDAPASMNLVVRGPSGLASLLIDEAGDVRQPDKSTFEQTPESVRGEARRLIRGGYKLPDRLILILDLPRVLAFVVPEANFIPAVDAGRNRS